MDVRDLRHQYGDNSHRHSLQCLIFMIFQEHHHQFSGLISVRGQHYVMTSGGKLDKFHVFISQMQKPTLFIHKNSICEVKRNGKFLGLTYQMGQPVRYGHCTRSADNSSVTECRSCCLINQHSSTLSIIGCKIWTEPAFSL